MCATFPHCHWNTKQQKKFHRCRKDQQPQFLNPLPTPCSRGLAPDGIFSFPFALLTITNSFAFADWRMKQYRDEFIIRRFQSKPAPSVYLRIFMYLFQNRLFKQFSKYFLTHFALLLRKKFWCVKKRFVIHFLFVYNTPLWLLPAVHFCLWDKPLTVQEAMY